MLHRKLGKLTHLVVAAAVGLPGIASAQTFIARLNGGEEVPAVSTTATGQFVMVFMPVSQMANYSLSYANLQGTVTQAHIHIGQPGVTGGISIWLCGTPALPGPAGTPTCTGTTTGVVKGSITSASVIGPPAQLITAGQLNEAIRMIRLGLAYVNVHTDAAAGGVGSGEIRGVIR